MTERIGIIGGGILGIAMARALSTRGLADVTVLEKEQRVATHQTGHNSGVVHAGLYYAPGSLKALLCQRGRVLTRDYCRERNLPYRELGKLVVALTEDELPALANIESRSIANGVPGLRRLGPEAMRDVEPHVAGVAALHSPHTAAVDFVAITEAMAEDIRSAGGRIIFGHEATAITSGHAEVRVTTTQAEFVFDRLIVCAGLQSDVVAGLVGAAPAPRILPFRGEYWGLSAAKQYLVRGMIYPVPDPGFPFLGVHFTRGVYNTVHVGPNAVPALAREGYGWNKMSFRDTAASIMWPGARALARKHWRMGAREIAASLIKPLYFQQARRFIPELSIEDLTAKTASGVRAQAWSLDGSLLDDFAIEKVGPVTLLRNAPSPAATSAMAIADYVLEHHVLGV
ncbi:L-2-hydroxyglutarate oxidase [Arthrobacter sp. B10-11]|uniref:L-2-hydroxyglutarate oxidase n=1 Tax=Arthrobacter sp. B10-11 TaxID=3081160 RepID=UPI0029554770|nr:L-2-hydroxyglutarate oxidase [Arthrobacter sp. B10-11]MDV8148243.1 L-2-hydroxyglutarate oxidase [Arthrobacter sp. B10-11]